MWTDEERQILIIPSPTGDRKYDPLAVDRRVRLAMKAYAGGGEQYAAEAKRYQGITERQKAGEKLTDDDMIFLDHYDGVTVKIACDAFGVKTMEQDAEKGWTETEILVAMGTYWAFVATKKKAGGSSENVSTGDGSPDTGPRPTKSIAPSRSRKTSSTHGARTSSASA